MEQGGYKISNLWRNLSGKEKMGFLFGALIIVVLIVVLSVMIANNAFSGESLEPGTSKEETYTDDNGNTVTKETTIDNDGGVTVTETKEDEWGNVTTTDPGLITTYFPYQVGREHEDWETTMMYYLYIDEENDKLIHALIEECDEENDRALAQDYINSIPLDMSGYAVQYEVFSDDAICEE